VFVTPRVFYGDEGNVKPDDYFGSEINKMMDKYDPAKQRLLRKEKRQQKKAARKAEKEQVASVNEAGAGNPETEKKFFIVRAIEKRREKGEAVEAQKEAQDE